jgi:lactoylglutathione lyase
MVKGLFETHLDVASLTHSMDFYENILGLQCAFYDQQRKAAFFWIGGRGEAMLGLWERPVSEIQMRHFAFRCDKEDILLRSIDFLKSRNLKPYNFLNTDMGEPMVFCWMPAIAIYFHDPDGHELEFISMLEGEGKPEFGIVAYQEWIQLQHD